ncbi:MAG: signal peptidase II [Acidobacteria bacterium]|nr:MAG: signal peptidase II [Acidobacteriota bacterium]
MEKTVRKHALIYFSAFLVILILDLLTKSLAEGHLRDKEISLLPFLHLVLVYNRGIAFGLFSEGPEYLRVPILLVIPIIAVVITLLYALKERSPSVSFLMGMVGGGALGNLYDRLFLGHVRDFIYLAYGKLSWPAFNLADASISLAIVLLLGLQAFGKAGKG